MPGQMICQRHKAPVEMYRVTNPPGTPNAGTSIARCSKCCKNVPCAYCPKCQNTVCLPCYNKAGAEKGKAPKLGPSLGESSSI